MTYNDPFIVSMNVARFQALLQSDIDDTTRRTVHQLLAEFGVADARMAVVRCDEGGEAFVVLSPSGPADCSRRGYSGATERLTRMDIKDLITEIKPS